ncbi:MAG TPA: plastocyanin/azurin family copper-binding protein [Actinomycetota bacterium]|nr:plastocyanin/azurin family copper-binding protein [Actinomycetota bacterium]
MKTSRTKFHRIKLSLAVTAVLMLAACGSSKEAPSDAASAGSSPSASAMGTHAGHSSGSGGAVEMRLIQYRPKQLDVKAGQEVTWTQKDAGFHTVTSGTVEQAAGGVTGNPDERFRSERLATDETFKFTFDEAGTFTYFCEIHPATMTGEVRVGA